MGGHVKQVAAVIAGVMLSGLLLDYMGSGKTGATLKSMAFKVTNGYGVGK